MSRFPVNVVTKEDAHRQISEWIDDGSLIPGSDEYFTLVSSAEEIESEVELLSGVEDVTV